MKLIPVDPENKAHIELLYELLKARPAKANISHKKMPTLEQHERFVKKHPYHDWCLIEIGGAEWDATPQQLIGSTFISKPAQPSVVGDELHVELFQGYNGYAYGEHALKLMIQKHPRSRFVANTSLTNYVSMALFAKLGFVECQRTFELIVPQEKAE
jgi:RimJ/RimL family protein N-acetyltransferase